MPLEFPVPPLPSVTEMMTDASGNTPASKLQQESHDIYVAETALGIDHNFEDPGAP